MTTIDKLANELFPCPSNCPSKQMTAKYMRENFKQSVYMMADEIRRVNGMHRVKPLFNPEGGTVYGSQMAVIGHDDGPKYILTDEQLKDIADKYLGHADINKKSSSSEKSGEK